MQQALLRVAVWYVAFSLIVGGILYALIPGLIPIYAVIAVIGGWGVLSGARDHLHEHAAKSLIQEWGDRHIAELERASAQASLVQQEPWFADAVVDMNEVGERRALDHIVVQSGDLIPNPYFVLPLPKLATWGFATPVEVREALRWANSPTPPVRWQNPGLREWLNLMGWPDAEAYARIGLFFWHTDDPARPSPQSAANEADIRRQNLVYDVPRPASLD